MDIRLLVTIRDVRRARTFCFDEALQSVLWVGLSEDVGPSDSLVGMSAAEGLVVVRPARDVSLVLPGSEDGFEGAATIEGNATCVLGLSTHRHEGASIFVRPLHPGVGRFRKLFLTGHVELVVGRGQGAALRYASQFVSLEHARLRHTEQGLDVEDLGSSNGTLVNERPLQAYVPRTLVPGDVVQVLDLTIMAGDGFLLVNCPPEFRARPFSGGRWEVPMGEPPETDARGAEASGHMRLFYPAPHLSKSVRPLKMEVDAPPQGKEGRDQPVLMQMGPSFLMGLASVFMVANSISGIAEGASVLSVLPSVAMAVAMVGGSVVWPLASSAYGRRQDAAREVLRCNRYVAYLDSVEDELSKVAHDQARVLHEARVPVRELLGRARDASPLLMSRSPAHADFLELRVGIGDSPLVAEVSWPERHFSVREDPMLAKAAALEARQPILRDVPVALDLARNTTVGILGERTRTWEFVRGLLVQVCTLYSYCDVRVVLLAQEQERREWQFLTSLGHLYDDGGARRLVAVSHRGLSELDRLLCRQLEGRADARADSPADLGTYYVVVCASGELAQRSEAVRRIERLRANLGFSLVHMGQVLGDLPRACDLIVELEPGEGPTAGVGDACMSPWQRPRTARMYERSDVLGSMRPFDPDIFVTREDAHDFGLHMARIHLDVPGRRQAMPTSLGFLEMFEVGAVGHLNVGQRWAEGDASRSLAVPVGVDERGDVAYLDFHEAAHGPHGLIAGTTGSGKSEFIVTLVLSLAVCYAPDEVAFVLIDYKGGGLAGAFDNVRHHLPHLAGVITNLDGSSIWRALVSIQSELRRRQALLNAARDASGESAVDIYRYLSLYRQGILSEPLPHLFVIADEFAELKQQEPDFMEELVSAARIGRSLGVHLVLATQKPTGVVDDQIWSNARLKVCLKVADAADSRELLRRDDAAAIARPGQFYMLVGYDEGFVGAQAAYAGAPYVRRERFEPRKNDTVALLDAEGNVLASQRPHSDVPQGTTSELDAVLAHVEAAARACGRQARRLWLDPPSPDLVLDDLLERYGEVGDEGLVCVVGEVDDPANQRRYRYELDLAAVGNVLLYGSAGSGVEEVLRSMLLGAASTHGADGLWLYGIDLGTGGLAVLEGLPQMERVVLPGDDERAQSLLRMARDEAHRRRAQMAEGAGDLARMVVCIVNIAAFMELYPDWEDDLVALARDGPRVGIHFAVTAGAAGEVRMRLRSCFGAEVPTLLNDPSDYLSILGGLGRMRVPTRERAGLVCVEGSVLEFQGARIASTREAELAAVQMVARRIHASHATCVPPIPQLPARVSPEELSPAVDAVRFPVGFSKEEVRPTCFDLRSSPCMLVLGDDREALGRYLRGAYETLRQSGSVSYRFVDTEGVLGDVCVGDASVLRADEEIGELVASLERGADGIGVVVFTSVMQTMSALDASLAARLQECLASECAGSGVPLVVASEAWRTKSVYEDWWRVVSAYGNGVWVGSGFGDQTAFRYARLLPQYRTPAERSDGFMAVQGGVTDVRLVESAADARDGGDDHGGR